MGTAPEGIDDSGFRALVERSPDAMFVVEDAPSFPIRYLNPAMVQLLGYAEAAELLGASSTDTFVHPDDRALIHTHRRMPTTEPQALDVRWVRRDGDVRDVHAWSSVITFGARRAFLVVARDVTEERRRDRERAETAAALRASETRHRLLFEGSPLPIAVFDATTLRFLEVNDAQIRLYGYSRAEFLAMRVTDLKAANDIPEFVETIASAAIGHIQHVGVRRHRCKDGRAIELDMTSHAITFAGRRAILAVGVDVTASRRLEDQLRTAQKLEAIGQLAGGIAHDFNNILGVVLANAEYAIECLGEQHPVTPELQQIDAAARRAAVLTRQLLAFSRKQPRQVKVVALNRIVTDLEKMLSRIVGENITMSAILASRLGSIEADVSQLEQVLVNLIVNARDAMPEGGRLTIETENIELDELEAAQLGAKPGGYVVLAVTDTGCGMDRATQARIFEPFFTTKGVGKGTGLGLATVFGIVKQSEGAVSVLSEPGCGSTFRIYFPRVDAVAAVASEPTSPLPLRGSETLLVVEDDAHLLDVLRRQLGALGYRLIDARSADDALDAVLAHPERIDLMVTDLVMPGTDGRGLARQLAVLRPETRVLFMSGYSEHLAARTGLAPDDHFLAKPFTTARLSMAIRRALEAPR